MNNYTPLHVYSHYSILRGLNSPREIATFAAKQGMTACALTDINNMAGCIEFYKACKDNKIKPIIGSTISTPEGSLVLIALNKNGYQELLQIVAKLNGVINQGIKGSCLTLNELSQFNLKNIICLTGHEGSGLYNAVCSNFKIKENWKDNAYSYLNDLGSLFETYIEFQFSEYDTLSQEIKEKYKYIFSVDEFDLIATPRVYYLEEQDKDLHKILLSVDEGTSINELNKINHPLYKFFDGYRFYMPSYNEMYQEQQIQSWNKERSYSWIHTDPIYEKALENTNELAKRVEDYEIQSMPKLPKFISRNQISSEQTFKEECTKGFHEKIIGRVQEEDYQIYKERVIEETEVFKEAELFDYFLIMKDIIDYAKSKDYLVGPGRGSVGGCLTGYLLGLHEMDSIKYDLIFSRFYNSGRKGSMPDIDTDFEKRSRSDVIAYIINKYGQENVMHIATYGTLMGRAALKAVFRAYGGVTFAEQNEITKNIVDKAKISDELELMKKAGEEPSVIKWCLQNRKSALSDWCILNKEGNLEGPLAARFEQAIRLEGVIATLSKHAAGVCIAPEPLKTLVPIVYDSKEKQQIIGCQMNDLEYVGLIKMDILGVSTLDRLKDINDV